jgi:hypothetical protein
MEEKNLKRVIGVVSLDYPNDWPEPEIQWGLVRKFWGRGYASEAAGAVKKNDRKISSRFIAHQSYSSGKLQFHKSCQITGCCF